MEWLKKIKEIIGLSDNNELAASAEIALEDRLASPFYGYFLISWLVLNWHIVYAALFIDQDVLFQKTNLLRADYVQLLLPPVYSWDFLFHFFIAPFTLTAMFFWVFPYLTRPFFKKGILNSLELQVIKIGLLKQERVEKRELEQEETKLIQTELQRAKVEKQAAQESPEILWEREYFQFKASPLYKKFNFIVSSLYEHNGDIAVYHPYNDEHVVFQIPKDILAFAHTNDLVVFDKAKNKIELTEKGKLFVRKFSAENAAVD